MPFCFSKLAVCLTFAFFSFPYALLFIFYLALLRSLFRLLFGHTQRSVAFALCRLVPSSQHWHLDTSIIRQLDSSTTYSYSTARAAFDRLHLVTSRAGPQTRTPPAKQLGFSKTASRQSRQFLELHHHFNVILLVFHPSFYTADHIQRSCIRLCITAYIDTHQTTHRGSLTPTSAPTAPT